MGRKIPARKHHGVRDPLKQNEQRLALIKDKINHPPEKQDFQRVSHKLADFIKLKEHVKSGKGKIKNIQHEKDNPENNKNVTNKTAKSQHHRPAKELQTIRRQQNEEDEDYIRRVNRITHESIKESQFEAKYGVDVIRNAKTNEITLKKRPVDDLEVQMKKAMRNKNADGTEKKKRNREPEVTLTAAERLKAAKEMIKKKKKEKQGNPIVEFQRDEVRFGEVVHGPPTLSMPRRAKKAETVARPGAKSSLLLHSVLKTYSVHRAAEGDGTRKAKAGGVKSGTVFKAIDLKGKRKELPAAARQMIEQQQQNVMNLYKEMKKKNRLENINISAVPE